MAEIIGLVAAVVNTILVSVQAYIKKIEDDVKAPFTAKTSTSEAGTQTVHKRQCSLNNRPKRSGPERSQGGKTLRDGD
jgi:hypothetical protein